MARAPAPAPAPARVEVEVKVVMGSAVVMPCPPDPMGARATEERGSVCVGGPQGGGERGARSESSSRGARDCYLREGGSEREEARKGEVG
jgi:hypothetical protein